MTMTKFSRINKQREENPMLHFIELYAMKAPSATADQRTKV